LFSILWGEIILTMDIESSKTDSTLQGKIDNILSQYNQAETPFSKNEIWDSLLLIKKQLGEKESILSMPLRAEMLAFELGTVDIEGNEASYPNLKNILDEEIIRYWEFRAASFTNPILTNAYADVIWQHSKLVRKKSNQEIGKLLIDSCFEILNTKKYGIIPLRTAIINLKLLYQQ
jgi:hypothetical protein